MRDLVRISFECEHCGGTVLTIEDDHTDDSIASCKACGRDIATFGDFKSKAIKEALNVILRHIRDSVK